MMGPIGVNKNTAWKILQFHMTQFIIYHVIIHFIGVILWVLQYVISHAIC